MAAGTYRSAKQSVANRPRRIAGLSPSHATGTLAFAIAPDLPAMSRYRDARLPPSPREQVADVTRTGLSVTSTTCSPRWRCALRDPLTAIGTHAVFSALGPQEDNEHPMPGD